MNTTIGHNSRLAIYICVLLITTTFILDRLIPEGLFLDGVTYAAISRNLAIGKGSFWSLRYWSSAGFHEHPPLMFGLQAIFFKLFGDHYWTEKLYCFIIWVATVFIIKKLWYISENKAKYSSALPIIMWCLIPTITWGYTNNILDCTMALFDLLAVLCLYQGLAKASGFTSWLWLKIGALFIFGAMLTKGPVGAFPLAVPGVYWLAYASKNSKLLGRAFLQTLFLLVVIAACYIILYQFPGPRSNFDLYLQWQLLAALHGQREVTGGSLGRFALVVDLVLELIIPVAIFLILFVVAKWRKIIPDKKNINRKYAVFFLLIGLCASLPMILSVKQRTFYLVPSLPYFVLAIATLAYPYYQALTDKWRIGIKSIRSFKVITASLAILLCVYLGSKFGQIGRNHEIIANMHQIEEHYPKGTVLGICPGQAVDYEFIAYVQRYNEIEIEPVILNADDVIVDKQLCNTDITPFLEKLGFKKTGFEMSRYDFYERKFPMRFDFIQLNPVYRKAGI